MPKKYVIQITRHDTEKGSRRSSIFQQIPNVTATPSIHPRRQKLPERMTNNENCNSRRSSNELVPVKFENTAPCRVVHDDFAGTGT